MSLILLDTQDLSLARTCGSVGRWVLEYCNHFSNYFGWCTFDEQILRHFFSDFNRGECSAMNRIARDNF